MRYAPHPIAMFSVCLLWLLLVGPALLAAQEAAEPPPAEKQPAAEQSADAEPDAKAPAAEASISFRADVAPIFVKNCLTCHGQNEPKGDFQLYTFEALIGSGYVEPGSPDDSELLRLVRSEDAEERMPKDGDPLPAEQTAIIERWIAAGAEFDADDPAAALVAIVPVVPQPDPPESYRVAVPITALAFRPDGAELAVGGYHEVTVWNPLNGELLRRITDVAERTYGLAYSPDGTRLAVAAGTPGELGEVKLFEPASGQLLMQLATMPDVAFDVKFNPDGSKLAASGADRSIRIFDVATGAEELLIEDHADWVMAIAYDPEGKRLASASRDKTSKVFDAATGDAQTTYPGHGQPVFGVTFSSDGSTVLTSGADKKIHVWNPADGKKTAEVTGYGHDVYDLIVAGDQLYSCSADKTVRQHGGEKYEAVRTYDGHNDWVYSLALSPATGLLASGGYDGEVRVWNVADGTAVATFVAAPGFEKPAAAVQASTEQAAAQ